MLFYRLQIFFNSVMFDLDPFCLTSDGIPERIF